MCYSKSLKTTSSALSGSKRQENKYSLDYKDLKTVTGNTAIYIYVHIYIFLYGVYIYMVDSLPVLNNLQKVYKMNIIKSSEKGT